MYLCATQYSNAGRMFYFSTFHCIVLLDVINVIPRRSRWPLRIRRGSAAARLLGLRVRILPGHACLCFVSVVCCHHSSKGVLPSVVCLCVIVKPRQWRGLGPLGAVEPWKKNVVRQGTCFTLFYSTVMFYWHSHNSLFSNYKDQYLFVYFMLASLIRF
jgi:hypothetical protein